MFELFKMLFFNATLYDFTKSLIYYTRFPLTILTSAQMIHENDAVVIIGDLHITNADISISKYSPFLSEGAALSECSCFGPCGLTPSLTHSC